MSFNFIFWQDEDVQDDSYTNLQHPTNDLYQTITSDHAQHDITTNEEY